VSIDVGALAEFADGAIRTVGVNGREVGIVRWNGAVYAVHNLCTHQSGPICAGVLSGRLTAASPGGMDLDLSTPILACPWHGWEFDLRTGRALHDAQHRLHTFPVHVENGRVLVDIGPVSRESPAQRTRS
jgi:nitrite reductase/ring-hydroxylating ferredoxin subunit